MNHTLAPRPGSCYGVLRKGRVSHMDLGLEVTAPFRAEVDREIGELDGLPAAETRTPLKRLRDRHHALARALASGMPHGEAALTVGLTPGTVSALLADPSFKELLTFYRADTARVYRNMHEGLAGVARDAVEIIAERLEEAPEKLTVSQLLEIAKMGADRTGHGPKSSQDVNVTIGLADRMAAARDRAVAMRQSRLIEGEVTDVTVQPSKEVE